MLRPTNHLGIAIYREKCLVLEYHRSRSNASKDAQKHFVPGCHSIALQTSHFLCIRRLVKFDFGHLFIIICIFIFSTLLKTISIMYDEAIKYCMMFDIWWNCWKNMKMMTKKKKNTWWSRFRCCHYCCVNQSRHIFFRNIKNILEQYYII